MNNNRYLKNVQNIFAIKNVLAAKEFVEKMKLLTNFINVYMAIK